MSGNEESLLKAEIDQISKRIDAIVKKLKTVAPLDKEEAGHKEPHERDQNSLTNSSDFTIK